MSSVGQGPMPNHDRQDLGPVTRYWRSWFDIGPWPTEDIYYGLIERFVRQVHVPEPAALEAVRGRSCLFLANHQTGVESLLFAIIASGLWILTHVYGVGYMRGRLIPTAQ